MHRKQDCAGRSMANMGKEVDTAKARLDNLEEVTHDHNVAHKAAIARMDEFERELQVLKARTSRTTDPGMRGVSPTPRCFGERDRSPAGSRAPRDVEAEFEIVIGGWKDARKAEKVLTSVGFLGSSKSAGLPASAPRFSRSPCTTQIRLRHSPPKEHGR